MKDVFIVTGAAGGMGIDACERFKDYGDLIICGQSEKKLNELKEKLNSSNNVIIAKCDVSKKEDVLKLAEIVKNAGNLCGIFNFAGVSEAYGNPTEIMRINLIGTALLAEHLYPMANEKTVLINTSSMTGYMAPAIKEADELMLDCLNPEFIDKITPYLNDNSNLAYYLSKRGVRILSESLASKWGEKGSRVISISPGVILTPMVKENMKKHADTINQMVAATPVKRIGKTEDITNLVEFLYSEKASFITGVDIRIDGGLIPVISKK